MSTSSDRYLRHNLIDWFSQAEVKAAKVAVVGAGAIGNEVVKNLALLGVGTIDVYDFDTVEIHNLTRSVFLREQDIGRSKAESVVARAAELDPSCRLRAISGDIRDQLNPGAISGYRAVISAVDNFDARLRLNQLCLLAGVDFVNSAIDSRFVSLDVFPHSRWDIACYECNLPETTYQRIAQRYSCGGLLKRAFDEKKVPTTTITASLAGAMAAAAALGLGETAENAKESRRVFLDSHTMLGQASRLSRQASCLACSGLNIRPQRVDRADLCFIDGDPRTATLAESNQPCASDEPVVIVLPEPVISGYRCNQCGGDRSASISASEILGHRARDYDDRLIWCPNCQAASMQIDVRDRFGLNEFETLTAQMPIGSPPAPFAIAHYGQHTAFIEWRSGPVHSGVVQPSPAQTSDMTPSSGESRWQTT